MIVVSDTSCVSNLITVGRISLLKDLFVEVVIPPAVIGVVGILVTAKERGLLSSVREVLDALDKEAGFRLSRPVRSSALRSVGEE